MFMIPNQCALCIDIVDGWNKDSSQGWMFAMPKDVKFLYEDIATDETFEFFSTREMGGNVPPVAELHMLLNPEVANAMQQYMYLRIGFGPNKDQLKNTFYRIMIIYKENLQQSLTSVKCGLMHWNYAYWEAHPKGFAYQKDVTSVEAIKAYLSNTGFEVIEKMLAPVHYEDKMGWYSRGPATRDFVQKCIEHSYYNDDAYLTVGVTLDDKAILFDFNYDAISTPKWFFAYSVDQTQADSKNVYVMLEEPVMEDLTSLRELVGANQSYQTSTDLKTGKNKKNKVKLTNRFAAKDEVEIGEDKEIVKAPKIVTDSVHPYYSEAKQRYIQSLVYLSSYKITCDLGPIFPEIELFDVFQIDAPVMNGKIMTSAIKGIFVVVGKKIMVTNNKFICNIIGTREDISDVN